MYEVKKNSTVECCFSWIPFSIYQCYTQTSTWEFWKKLWRYDFCV